MALNLDQLQAGQSIVDRAGRPNDRFLLYWQRQITELKRQDAGQTNINDRLQTQQDLLVQMFEVLTAIVLYQGQVQAAAQPRSAYTQCAVGTVANATGTDISNCGSTDFPPWPTPPF